MTYVMSIYCLVHPKGIIQCFTHFYFEKVLPAKYVLLYYYICLTNILFFILLITNILTHFFNLNFCDKNIAESFNWLNA